jgi:hypothetical protein
MFFSLIFFVFYLLLYCYILFFIVFMESSSSLAGKIPDLLQMRPHRSHLSSAFATMENIPFFLENVCSWRGVQIINHAGWQSLNGLRYALEQLDGKKIVLLSHPDPIWWVDSGLRSLLKKNIALSLVVRDGAMASYVDGNYHNPESLARLLPQIVQYNKQEDSLALAVDCAYSFIKHSIVASDPYEFIVLYCPSSTLYSSHMHNLAKQFSALTQEKSLL